PMALRNAPTGLMKELGYGKDYKYAHDYPNAQVHQESLPHELRGKTFYDPTDRGYEARVRERMKSWKSMKDSKKPQPEKK
ncbi:MAG: replication-associated recombination protein A, partial [Syntrophales bacterium]|nr:replication-associated recombination protein A [Syntrophales bacterium]